MTVSFVRGTMSDLQCIPRPLRAMYGTERWNNTCKRIQARHDTMLERGAASFVFQPRSCVREMRDGHELCNDAQERVEVKRHQLKRQQYLYHAGQPFHRR